MMIPLVGKSGPFTCSIRSDSSASGLSSTQIVALDYFPAGLWGRNIGGHAHGDAGGAVDQQIGGTGRAIPGGSFRLSSKFGSQSTVSFSISRSISSEILAMRASV